LKSLVQKKLLVVTRRKQNEVSKVRQARMIYNENVAKRNFGRDRIVKVLTTEEGFRCQEEGKLSDKRKRKVQLNSKSNS